MTFDILLTHILYTFYDLLMSHRILIGFKIQSSKKICKTFKTFLYIKTITQKKIWLIKLQYKNSEKYFKKEIYAHKKISFLKGNICGRKKFTSRIFISL